jgi:hypothetical protein
MFFPNDFLWMHRHLLDAMATLLALPLLTAVEVVHPRLQKHLSTFTKRDQTDRQN